MRRAAARLVAFTSIALLSACGLRGEEQAQVIDDVQYELLVTTTSTTSTTAPALPTFQVNFYWHSAGDNRLRVIERPREEPPTPGQTLLELVAGPTPEDIEENPDLLSRLDQSMQPELTQLEDNVYQIRIQWLAEDDLSIEQAAEFVCTATQFDGIDAITIVNNEGFTFTLSGVGAVPIAGPARPADFADCVEEIPIAEPEGDGDGDGAGSSTTTAP